MTLLELHRVSKHFGGIRAVEEFSLEVQAGEIVGLIGPNGAGKSTLFNCVAGVFPPTSGEIVFQGKRIDGRRPWDLCRMGIARTFQIVKPFASRTVLYNVTVGAFAVTSRLGEAERWALEVLRLLRLEDKADMRAANLAIADRKRLEIARALATRPRLLLLDEVMAGLRPTEVDEMVAVIRRLGRPGPAPKKAYIRAHLRLSRSWEFVAVGGNVKPLAWEMAGPGRWEAALMLLSSPLEAFLEELPPEADLSLNGRPLSLSEGAALGRMLRTGANLLELTGSPDRPRARLRGRFFCRGEALAPPPPVIAGPWTLNGFPYFPGPGRYRQAVEIPSHLVRGDLSVWLEVGGLAGYALVRLNGIQMGSLAWPPYRLHLGAAEIMRPGPNLLELEIYAPVASPAWAFKGLLGEVSLLFGEKPLDENIRRSPGESEFSWPLAPL